MPTGSTYSTLKAAIFNTLTARPALANVAVRYQAPERPEDVVGPTGKSEAIWLDNVPKGEHKNVVICGTPLSIDEEYGLQVSVQVLIEDGGGSGTQQAADARCDVLLYEVMQAMATDPTWGVTTFPRLETTQAVFAWHTGVLPNGMGHGARCDLILRVLSRLSFI